MKEIIKIFLNEYFTFTNNKINNYKGMKLKRIFSIYTQQKKKIPAGILVRTEFSGKNAGSETQEIIKIQRQRKFNQK